MSVPRGETAQIPFTLLAPAPQGGVIVTLTSSDPRKVTVTQTIFIEVGSTHGTKLGSATITATAPGFTSDTQAVRVQK